MKDDSTNPSLDVYQKYSQNVPIVVHHNHLSQESLSKGDWKGLDKVFDEVFAHCADNTTYWGRMLDPHAVDRTFGPTMNAEVDAESALFGILSPRPMAVDFAHHFRKEVINRAMRQRGYVEYEYQWGSGSTPPHPRPGGPAFTMGVGQYGALIDSEIDAAAMQLAPNLSDS